MHNEIVKTEKETGLIQAQYLQVLRLSTLTTNFQLEKITETPQIISLVKQLGESTVVLEIVRLIVELSYLVPYRGQGDPFTKWAKMLVSEFDWIRVEEIAYIFRGGANGKWGKDGKIYGELTYSFITEWIAIYDETERQPHFVNENIKKQGQQKENLKGWQTDFSPMIESVGRKIEDEKKELIEKLPATDSNTLDEKQLALFQAFGKDWTIPQLESALDSARKSLHFKTGQAIMDELKLRK